MSFIFYKKILKTYKIFNNIKGANNIKYKTVAAIGDKNGGFGIGVAKSNNQSISISKAFNLAKFKFIKIPLDNETIPYPVKIQFASTTIQILPLKYKWNFSSGGIVRSIFNIIGIHKITSKVYGSKNFYNIINCVYTCFKNLKSKIFLKRKNVY